MKNLSQSYNIKIIEVDLSKDFKNFDKIATYPIECMYHMYAYKLFPDYDYVISIESDIVTLKKMEINLKEVLYIGGSIENNLIRDFIVGRDYPKYKNTFGTANLNVQRIRGGVKIYNIKNLLKINFYEKIVEYYNTSLKINAPRLGDDSLMVLYQLYHKNHFKLFDSKSNFQFIVHSSLHKKNLEQFMFIHLHRKYWKIKDITKLSSHERYFYDNIMEFIYNNFSLSFIEKYIPEIYLPLDNVKIPFYYYKPCDNFGDLITPYFLNKFANKDEYTYNFANTGSKVISCGSIMRLCNDKTLVYGSGIRDRYQDISHGNIQFVRGPLTKKRLEEIGCYCPPIYGDPGLLLPLYYNPKVKKTHELGIIPHHIHYNKISKMYKNISYIKVINLINKDIEVVIQDILSCKKTISSSLHGLIVSDAYLIPNKWVQFSNEINGDDTKFFDYFESVNRKDKTPIDCMNYKKIPENTFNLIENVSINFDIDFLEKKFFIDKNGIRNYTKYLYQKYCS
jgi:hypothetical protein